MGLDGVPGVSSIAAWSYRAIATVRPYLGEDTEEGGIVYGEPYEIACSWEAGGNERQDANGDEFVSTYELWTGDARPKHNDRVTVAGTLIADLPVRQVQGFGMEMFNDVPDYRIAL